jgi:hypothetical protein
VFGPAGFGARSQALAMLVPGQPAGQPLAVAIHYDQSARVNEAGLLQSAQEAMRHCLFSPEPAEPAKLPTAA